MAGATVDNFISKWGKEEGLKKHTEYIEKLKNRPRPNHPNNKKYWSAQRLIENYDKKKFICLENAPDYFFVEFETIWCELRDNNPKFDSAQLYSKTNKRLFTAKSQIKKEYWIQRFWTEEEAELKMNNKRTQQIANEEWYIKKYGEVKGKQLWQDKCESSNLLVNWTKKFGKVNAELMFDEYKDKLSKMRSLEDYKEKYGDMAEEMQSEWKQKQSRNKDWYIRKYGTEKGTQVWDDILLKRRHYTSLDGMIERYGEKEGTEKYNKWYDATLGKSKKQFIELYGNIEGLKKWKEIDARRMNSWKESTTLEAFKNKYGEKYGEEKWIAWKTFSGNYSQVSFNLFTRLVEAHECLTNATFGENETIIDVQDFDISNAYIKPDFLWKKKIIEFNGTYWHRDTRFFDNSPENIEIREKDLYRNKILLDKGYEVLVVWEYDYEQDPFQIFDQCINFLLN